MKKNLHTQTNSKYYKLSLLASMALWDGHITKKGRLCVRHSQKQLEYLQWKADLLYNAFDRKVNVNKYGGKYPYCEISFTNDITKRLRKLLYIDDKKTISQSALNLLKTSVALLIMYLDNGCLVLHKFKNDKTKIKSREIYLSSHSFGYSGNEMLKCWFKRNFNITTSLRKDRGRTYIAFNATNANKLLNLFDAVPDSMVYKIDMKYTYPRSPSL